MRQTDNGVVFLYGDPKCVQAAARILSAGGGGIFCAGGSCGPGRDHAGRRIEERCCGSKQTLERGRFWKQIKKAANAGRDYREQLIERRAARMAWLPPTPIPPAVKSPIFNPIDQFIAAKWEQAGSAKFARAPRLCSDTVFLRRVYLDLIGVIPTVAEAQTFLRDSAPDKRARLVDELLARKEDYAANWTPFWEDALASADTNVRGGIATHGNLRNWIRQSFLENKPYDVMVAELLDPLMPGYQKTDHRHAQRKAGDHGICPERQS